MENPSFNSILSERDKARHEQRIREDAMRSWRIIDTIPITVKPSTTSVHIPFKTAFVQVPHLIYSIVVAKEDAFTIRHEIQSISKEGFTLSFHNKVNVPVTVKINYRTDTSSILP